MILSSHTVPSTSLLLYIHTTYHRYDYLVYIDGTYYSTEDHSQARGFWTAHQDAFFDIRVFYPKASSYHSTFLSFTYHKHEQLKKHEYSERVH